MRQPLPIDEILPALVSAVSRTGRVVLEAPPGAGKTTRVPLALLDAGTIGGRILMLEPRRLAARAAAERMAATLNEPVGQTVGFRIRGDTQVSKTTRVEVVTEGILTRMIQSDPSLDGIGTVIFDEFHERSLASDLGLALCLEIAGALRDDLSLLVMSATLDGASVAKLMGAEVIRSDGRAFPVETWWRERPMGKALRLEQALAETILDALPDTDGAILAFLPGEGEIRRTEAALSDRLPQGCAVRPLFGAMPFAAQRAAIAPDPSTRKIVLATSIAETSLTIEDVRVVVDAGRARRARFDPGSGMSRLVTERVSRAEAEQRRGRAGRVAEGVCYRLWTKGEEGGFPAYPPTGIEAEDLSGLALDLALWGTRDPTALPFLTPPPAGPYNAALRLLRDLGAVDEAGSITDHGRAVAAMPLHPRLGHMLVCAGSDAAPMAALLSDRDPMRGVGAVDLGLRLAALKRPHPQADRGAIERIRGEAKRLGRLASSDQGRSPAQMAALAYPDRIGLRRSGDDPRWVLSGGKGVTLSPEDPMAGARLIVVTDTDGGTPEARIRQAIEITEADLRDIMGERIVWEDRCLWSRRDGKVLARQQETLGAVILDDRVWRDAPREQIARAMLDGVRALGLTWSDAAHRFRARVELARADGVALPAMTDAALLEGLEDWLLPHLSGVQTAEDWRQFDMLPALRGMLDWQAQQDLDRFAPAQFKTPLGRSVPIDYSEEHPSIAVRLQELFGQASHPTVAGRPLRVALLSPAGRPVQVTLDLPGFWASSYADVRKDMRGRYPRHPWPEDPLAAAPTQRAKPRGQ